MTHNLAYLSRTFYAIHLTSSFLPLFHLLSIQFRLLSIQLVVIISQVELREKEVKYINALGVFLDPHTLQCTGTPLPTVVSFIFDYLTFSYVIHNPYSRVFLILTTTTIIIIFIITTEQKIVKKEVKEIVSTITSRRFVIAVGGRPTPLDIPGGELAISSDDLFMKKVRTAIQQHSSFDSVVWLFLST